MIENEEIVSPGPPLCLQVALPLPTSGSYDYLPPAALTTEIQSLRGARILVPFGSRRLVGLILGAGPSTMTDHSKLRPAETLLDPQPALPAPLLELMCWASHYYHHPIGDALFSLLPPALRRPATLTAPAQTRWHALAQEPPTRAHRQRALWQWLVVQGDATREELAAAGFTPSLVRTLQRTGSIEARDTPQAPCRELPACRPTLQTLNQAQQAILDQFPEGPGKYSAALLHGITGSGKTEVYLHLIAHALKAGKQAILLVPEISLTPQTVQRVTDAFGIEQVAVLHSGIGEAERLRAWLDLRDGRRGVLVGARSAVLAPMRWPGIIIVDEEHDASYKQQDGFRYSARDLAVKRAQHENIPILLGSATPSLETLHNAQIGRYCWLRLPERVRGACLPEIRILDIRRQEVRGGVASPLTEKIREHLAKKGQVLIFQNRRGYAPVLVCDNCGHSSVCAGCDRPLTVHLARRALCCHHCGQMQALPKRCPSCDYSELTMLGAGTQRISDFLEKMFPEFPVLRVDRDAMRSAQQHAALQRQVRSGQAAILVGTQMLAKGHDFPNLTLVGVLDVDGGLLSSDFRGLERTAQLITQVAGRAGRADRAGEVILQTRRPEHVALQCLVQDGYDALADLLLADRRNASLPPFAALANISAESRQSEAAAAALQTLLENIGSRLAQTPGVEAWGPAPAPMPRRAGRHRHQIILWGTSRGRLQALLPAVRAQLDVIPQRGDLRLYLDVDPLDLY